MNYFSNLYFNILKKIIIIAKITNVSILDYLVLLTSRTIYSSLKTKVLCKNSTNIICFKVLHVHAKIPVFHIEIVYKLENFIQSLHLKVL